MTDPVSPSPDSTPRVVSVACPRVGRQRALIEHLICPYCYGRLQDIATGDRACFCDYDPSRDPVSFGFPDDSGRIRNG